jgi:hypothetical protein
MTGKANTRFYRILISFAFTTMMLVFGVSTAITGYINSKNEFGEFVLLNGMYDLIASGATLLTLILIWIIRKKPLSYKIPVLILWTLLSTSGTFIQLYSFSSENNSVTTVINQWATMYGMYTPFALQFIILIILFIAFILCYSDKNNYSKISNPENPKSS